MPEFSITRRISAPVEAVWGVLDDFGDIQRWNPGVKTSALTSSGPVGEGSTRRCDFSPIGAVGERIDCHRPNERMTINIHETSRLPISDGVADFKLARDGEGTNLALDYSYNLNRLGRMARGYTDRQLRKGLAGLVDGLQAESERIANSTDAGRPGHGTGR
jgi:carbon monoxide dehydrogenase subunit G